MDINSGFCDLSRTFGGKTKTEPSESKVGNDFKGNGVLQLWRMSDK